MDELSAAVVVWINDGPEAHPTTRDERVTERFGARSAGELLPRLRQIEHHLFASDAVHHVRDLAEMGDRAAAEVSTRYPELSGPALKALANLYAWSYR